MRKSNRNFLTFVTTITISWDSLTFLNLIQPGVRRWQPGMLFQTQAGVCSVVSARITARSASMFAAMPGMAGQLFIVSV